MSPMSIDERLVSIAVALSVAPRVVEHEYAIVLGIDICVWGKPIADSHYRAKSAMPCPSSARRAASFFRPGWARMCDDMRWESHWHNVVGSA